MKTKEFLINSDETGRFIVKSFRTGRSYFVEAIDPEERVNWGSLDPATKNFTVKKGWQKYKGSIDENESLITEENGFQKIHSLAKGMSPDAYISELDSKYPTIERKGDTI